MQADLIMFTAYYEVDLNDTPCLFPDCGHILTVESADGHLEFSNYYATGEYGEVTGLMADGPEPFKVEVKGCPQCRGSLRNINRYGRFIKRALLDESTKRFITWSNAQLLPLTTHLQAEETRLKETTNLFMNQNHSKLKARPTAIIFSGKRRKQVSIVRELTGLQSHLGPLTKLRTDINAHHVAVCEREQPYARVDSLAVESSRKTGNVASFRFDSTVLQTRAGLLSAALLLRCDYDILSNVLEVRQNHKPIHEREHAWLRQNITFDLTANRNDCMDLLKKATKNTQPMVIVQARVLFAKFVALERSASVKPAQVPTLLNEAREHLQQALTEVQQTPSIVHMKEEVEDVQKMLREGTFYAAVTSAEMQAVYSAMATEFSGTGHWYYCENRHPVNLTSFVFLGRWCVVLTKSSLQSENVECRCRVRGALSAERELVAALISQRRV